MIEESAIEYVSRNLTEKTVIEFFRDNIEKIVYFYHMSDTLPSPVPTLTTFEAGELKIPIRSNENGTFFVLYLNNELAKRLIEQDFKIASSRLKKCIDIANSLSGVNGLFIQGNGCWFTIGLKELNHGLSTHA